MTRKTENKHFYRLPIDTTDGAYLKILLEKSELAMRSASALAMELGAVRFSPNAAFLVGGIGQLYFENQPDKDTYKILRFKGKYFECHPDRDKEKGAEVLKRILALPVVHFRDLAPVFGNMQQGTLTPAFFDYKEYIYLSSVEPLELVHDKDLEVIDKETFYAMNERREKEK